MGRNPQMLKTHSSMLNAKKNPLTVVRCLLTFTIFAHK